MDLAMSQPQGGEEPPGVLLTALLTNQMRLNEANKLAPEDKDTGLPGIADDAAYRQLLTNEKRLREQLYTAMVAASVNSPGGAVAQQ